MKHSIRITKNMPGIGRLVFRASDVPYWLFWLIVIMSMIAGLLVYSFFYRHIVYHFFTL